MRRMTSGRRIERPCSLLRLRRHKKDNKEERNPVVSLVYPIECQRERCQIINRILFAFRSCWLFLYENLDSSPEKKIKGELQHADHRWETHAGIISWKASRKWSGFIQRFLSYLIETTTQLSSTLLLLNGSHTIRTQEYAHDYYLISIFFKVLIAMEDDGWNDTLCVTKLAALDCLLDKNSNTQNGYKVARSRPVATTV